MQDNSEQLIVKTVTSDISSPKRNRGHFDFMGHLMSVNAHLMQRKTSARNESP